MHRRGAQDRVGKGSELGCVRDPLRIPSLFMYPTATFVSSCGNWRLRSWNPQQYHNQKPLFYVFCGFIQEGAFRFCLARIHVKGWSLGVLILFIPKKFPLEPTRGNDIKGAHWAKILGLEAKVSKPKVKRRGSDLVGPWPWKQWTRPRSKLRPKVKIDWRSTRPKTHAPKLQPKH